MAESMVASLYGGRGEFDSLKAYPSSSLGSASKPN